MISDETEDTNYDTDAVVSDQNSQNENHYLTASKQMSLSDLMEIQRSSF